MIIKRSKIPRLVRARTILIFLVIKNGLLSRSQAAEYLGISQPAVTRAINRIYNDNELREEINKLATEMSIK